MNFAIEVVRFRVIVDRVLGSHALSKLMIHMLGELRRGVGKKAKSYAQVTDEEETYVLCYP